MSDDDVVVFKTDKHPATFSNREGGYTLVSQGLQTIVAERVGFEPTLRRTVNQISSLAHSTTLPPLQAQRRELYLSPLLEIA